MSATNVRVAASGQWVDPDGFRLPAGAVHAWYPGTNSTVCGAALSRSQLQRFPHVRWADVQVESGGTADAVQMVCPRCAAGSGGRRRDDRGWRRIAPRP